MCVGSVDRLRFFVFPLLSASSPRALNVAFFSLRVREAAASGLRGEDTAGRCSSSRRAVGRAEGTVTGRGCWASAIAPRVWGAQLQRAAFGYEGLGNRDFLGHITALEKLLVRKRCFT